MKWRRHVLSGALVVLASVGVGMLPAAPRAAEARVAVERDVPVRMGISCSGPDGRFSLEYLEWLRGPMVAGARDLSEKLGGIERA